MNVWLNNDPKQGRDPARIDTIIESLRTAWKHSPQLRLGQLLQVLSQDTVRPLFYVEDDEWRQLLDSFPDKYHDNQT